MPTIQSPAFILSGPTASGGGPAPRNQCREGRYTARFAQTAEELDEVLRLRFEVFNLELNEGLEASYINGRDEDEFDQTCHHLIVVENETGRIVGTYRLRTMETAGSAFGFYSAGEFAVESLPYEVLSESIEIGRACIAREHRNSRVLFLLWKGLAMYLTERRKRYLFGCCSLPSQDCADGARAYRRLVRDERLHESLRVAPRPEYLCPAEDFPAADGPIELPMLFEIYLRLGAKICGAPAIDRRFKTIDFFVVVDARGIPDRYAKMFFGR
ncbi:MAG: GNAT family N-acetyltransferase [Acidobacteria bacterium]|nr:GNAT family N-acetyltransferase [Acidobacteriota bacterium]